MYRKKAKFRLIRRLYKVLAMLGGHVKLAYLFGMRRVSERFAFLLRSDNNGWHTDKIKSH